MTFLAGWPLFSVKGSKKKLALGEERQFFFWVFKKEQKRKKEGGAKAAGFLFFSLVAKVSKRHKVFFYLKEER